ncbi:hypothetical protein RUND412_003320 [Rhizina undulata]
MENKHSPHSKNPPHPTPTSPTSSPATDPHHQPPSPIPEYTFSPSPSSFPSPIPPPAPTPPSEEYCTSPTSSTSSLLLPEPASKRPREHSPESPSPRSTKKRTIVNTRKPDVAAENRLLLDLKDGKDGAEGMKWKDVVKEFEKCGWTRKEKVLKMRWKCLKENKAWWEEDEVDCLYQAIHEVESEYARTKWESVARKMLDLGSTRNFTGMQCEKKWKSKKAKTDEKDNNSNREVDMEDAEER